MGVSLREVWSRLWSHCVRLAAAALQLASTSVGSLREPSCRQRLLILLAAILVCAYAIGVFSHVSTTPDLGLRFAFSRIVNRVYPEFLVVSEDEPVPDLQDAQIVQIGEHHIEIWPQLL